MSEFHVTVAKVDEAFTHPDDGLDHLSVVKALGMTFIAGKLEDGRFRYNVGDLVICIPVNSVIPLDLLKYQGFYWDSEKDRGLLKGGKRNRVGAVSRGSITSDGILFPLDRQYSQSHFPNLKYGFFIQSEEEEHMFEEGQKVEHYLDITEYKP